MNNILSDSFMLYFVETGLTNYIRSISTVSDRLCQADTKPKGKMSAFKLKDLTPAFLLWYWMWPVFVAFPNGIGNRHWI